jgi:ATP-dependent Lhr-like helicase
MMLKKSPVTEWFREKYKEPTPAQAAAWPKIEGGRNVLIVSPTGTGKTLAAFLSVLNELALLHEDGKLRNSIYAVYVSPLRALSYDLEKNLAQPLGDIYGSNPPIRVGLRTGDTTQSERQKQFTKPPHILLTTPESLSLLLSQTKWLPHLQSVRWMIVDEIHALAENKRGAHLSLSMERLNPPQRIGLSATVAPLSEVAQFLVGTRRECEIVDASTTKKVDLRVYSPLTKDPYPPSGYTGERLIKELARLVQENRTTVIFTNTRSGAEAATFWLHREMPELTKQIECHHASLDRDVRQEVEDRLKRGELRAVVCSTSLELGIDIGSVDLVVMLSTPKGVSRALQRTGRAGHNIHVVSRGLLMATNMNDLVECCATALLARTRQLDPVRLPKAPLDVLAQHLVSMGCIRRWSRAEALELARGAYPYRNLSEQDLDAVLDYLAGGGKALRQQYTELFGKIDLDEGGFETRQGRVRRDLLENIGVIPNEGMVRVKLRNYTLGQVEEIFIRQLQVGDVFILAGRPVRVERITLMECFVSRADHAQPTVPRWNANKMPLTNKVAEEIISFRSQLRKRLEAESHPEETRRWIAERLECGAHNAAIINKMYFAQHMLSEIPTADFLLVEEFFAMPKDMEGAIGEESDPKKARARQRWLAQPARHYFFHTLIGRAGCEALSRVVALRLSRLRGGNAVATPDDYGFVLTVTPAQVFGAKELPQIMSPDNFEEDLREALSRSDLLKYHFRNAAQTGMMVYRNYFGERKSVRKLQWSSEIIFNVLMQYEPDHVLLREAWRDAIHVYIDSDGARRYLEGAASRPMRIKTIDRVPPLSFALFATKIKEALKVEDPRETMERLFHLWWSRIEPESSAAES